MQEPSQSTIRKAVSMSIPVSWRRLSVGLLALLLGGSLVGWHWRSALRRTCTFPVAENYIVYFKWRGYLAELRAVDTRSGKEESSEELRKVLWKESADIAKKIAVSSHLDSAEGSFSLNLFGCGEPYLTTWNSATIPQVSNLLEAAEMWNVDELRRILGTGINVNARDMENHTALMLAAADPRKQLSQNPKMQSQISWKPTISAIELLLKAGADPNAKGNYGTTPLMLASASTVRLLLDAGADVNAHDDFGKTPLMFIAEEGEAEAINLELAKHANVQAQDRDGWTALMYAADKGSVEALKILLEAGSDVHARNNAGRTALMIAVERANREPHFRLGVKLLGGKI